jgi:tetratricopeptide (TPR) repeat protein
MGLRKPCIVLLERNATVDIAGYFPEERPEIVGQLPIDMDRHFSDVKDRYYVRYDKERPKESRALIEAQYAKLKEDIRNEFLNVLCPHKDVIIGKELPSHLSVLVDALNKPAEQFTKEDLAAIRLARSNVERLASEYHLKLPKKYSRTLAELLHRAKESSSALEILAAARTGTKGDVNLYALEAQIRRDTSDLDGAIVALDAAIGLHPELEWLWHNKAICLDHLRRVDDALVCYEKAISLDSSCRFVFFQYGVLLYDRQRYLEAHEAFKHAGVNDPTDKHVPLWKARSLHKLGKTSDAVPILQDLISLDEKNVDALFALAQMTDDEVKELELLDRVVAIAPRHGGAICSRAAVLSNLGRASEALDYLYSNRPTCKEFEKCPTILTTIAITESKRGRYTEALNAVDELLLIIPHDDTGRSIKAQCLVKLGNYREASELLEKLHAEEKTDAREVYNLGCCYAQLNQPERAMEYLRKAIVLDPGMRKLLAKDADLETLRQDVKLAKEFRTLSFGEN